MRQFHMDEGRISIFQNRIKVFKLTIMMFIIPSYSFSAEFSTGRDLLEIDKFDSAIREFSKAIEDGKSKEIKKHFLKIIKLKPNKEIIRRIAEITKSIDIYPVSFSKYYEWYPIFSPDSSKILFQGWQKGESKINNAIYIMDIDGKNIREIVSSEYNNFSPQFSPDSKWIIYQSIRNDTNRDGIVNSKDNSGIYLIDIEKEKEKEVTGDRYQNYSPQFSPDSKWIMYQSIRNDTNRDGIVNSKDNSGIYLIDIEKEKEREVTGDRYQNYSPQFSPDSKWIMYQSIRNDTNRDGIVNSKDNSEIHIKSVDGDEILKLSDKFKNSDCLFSGDSKFILFSSIRKDTNQDRLIDSKDNRGIYLVEGKSGKEKKIVSEEYDNEPAGFSPDGRLMVYTSYRNDTNRDGRIDSSDNRGLYLVSIEPGEESQIVVDDKYDNKFLSFYPDGKRIIFESWRKDTNQDGILNILDNSNVYLIDVASEPAIRIITVINSDYSCTRTIEIITDPLFRKMSKDIENTLSLASTIPSASTILSGKSEFIREGEHHLKLIEKFKDIDELSKPNYSITFSKKNKILYKTIEYKEIFRKEEIVFPPTIPLRDFQPSAEGPVRANSSNPILSLVKEIGNITSKPMKIKFLLTVPGKILKTNALNVKASTVSWEFSLPELIKINKDYEVFVYSRTINSGVVVLLSIILFSLLGIAGYKILSVRNKRKLKLKEIIEGSAEGYNYLASSYKNRGMYDEAIAHYKKAIELSKKATYYYNIACCYVLKNDTPNAISNLKNAVSINKDIMSTIKKNPELKDLYSYIA